MILWMSQKATGSAAAKTKIARRPGSEIRFPIEASTSVTVDEGKEIISMFFYFHDLYQIIIAFKEIYQRVRKKARVPQ